jgi:8-oxo-dGTP pyrophosphatase MutT (NUDIX family)
LSWCEGKIFKWIGHRFEAKVLRTFFFGKQEIQHKNLRFIFTIIMKGENRIFIQAGGGLVENERREILFIFRRGKWDLPKGKLDPGETLEQCAIREVEEETGIGKLMLIRFLLITEHEYTERGEKILKETHWWLMKTSGSQTLIPQTEEDITEIKWIGPAELKRVLQNTYPAIVDVLKAGEHLL